MYESLDLSISPCRRACPTLRVQYTILSSSGALKPIDHADTSFHGSLPSRASKLECIQDLLLAYCLDTYMRSSVDRSYKPQKMVVIVVAELVAKSAKVKDTSETFSNGAGIFQDCQRGPQGVQKVAKR